MYSEPGTHRVINSNKVFALIMSFALIPGILGSWAALLLLQQRYIPIIENFQIDTATVGSEGDVTLAGQFSKRFPDWACKFDSLRWYMPETNIEGRELKLRVRAEYADKRQKNEENNRYSGLNLFSGWLIKISVYPDLRVFSGYVQHKCLGFFPARTPMPFYEIPRDAYLFRSPAHQISLKELDR